MPTDDDRQAEPIVRDTADVVAPLPISSRRPSPAQALAVAGERLLWNRRAESWDLEGSVGLTKVVEAVLDACQSSPETVAVDLGCGSGQVTIPLARTCAHVLAIDVSPPSIARLQTKARAADIRNIQPITHPIETLDLPPGSVDLIVSNYALHHLRDADKAELLCRSYQWLRPGGRLVIGDMMFGRGITPGDRAIIASKAQSLIRRGPGGWWRLTKNVWRFTFRLREKPLSAAKWELLAYRAGFSEVAISRVLAEACLLSATKPLTGDTARPAKPSTARPRGPDAPRSGRFGSVRSSAV
jgi:SAM-dependent methyltransferase